MKIRKIVVALGLISAFGLVAGCGSTTTTAPDGSKVKVEDGGDKVSVEITPYDLTKGRILFRHK